LACTAASAVYAPTAYAVGVEPKASYEYSASVQDPDYTNYLSVRSEDPAVPLPSSKLAIKSEPIVTEAVAPLVLKSAPIVTLQHAPLVQQVIPSYQPIFEHSSIVRANAPVIKTYQPTLVAAQPTIVAAQPTFIATPTVLRQATPIVEVQQEVVGHAVVDQGLLAQKTQYHSQDELGRAAYGHSEALQTHNAYQDENGGKTGSFSYIAPNGRLLTTNYIADANGYRAATNALPEANIEAHSRHRRSANVVAIASSPLLSKSVLTQVVDQPGHSYSYRVDAVNTHPTYKTIQTVHPLVNTVYPQHVAYSAVPTVYASNLLNQPLTYNTYAALPTYKAATLTNIVHNPGHSASYRVD
jgi:hypothetical protein